MGTLVRIEFGNRCSNHGGPEYLKLAKMLCNFFPDNLCVIPYPIRYYNHFRMFVDEYLVFDSYSRYPPVIEAVKCIEEFQRDTVPTEIPFSLGIPFSYSYCPEHDGLLVEGQSCGIAIRNTQRLSGMSSKGTTVETRSSSEQSHPSQAAQARASAVRAACRRSRSQVSIELLTIDGVGLSEIMQSIPMPDMEPLQPDENEEEAA